MMKKITIKFLSLNFEIKAVLNDTSIAEQIYKILPKESIVQRWGEEIYFQLPLKAKNELSTLDVEVGDVAWWPDGSCLCIFFGKTPISDSSKPKPYSEVTIVGKIETVTKEILEKLSQVKPNSKVFVSI